MTNMTEIITIISTLISLSASMGALYIAYRKFPSEARHLSASSGSSEADTAEKYRAIADRAADRALALDQRIQQLEKRVLEQAEEMEHLRCENERLAHWAGRLVHQVKSMGGDPVPMPGDDEKHNQDMEVRREKSKRSGTGGDHG